MAQDAARSRINEDNLTCKINSRCYVDRLRLPQEAHNDIEPLLVSNRILPGLKTSDIQAHGKLLEKKKKKSTSTKEERSETKSFAGFLLKLQTNPMTTPRKLQQQWLCSLREPTINDDSMEMVFFEAIPVLRL